MIFQKSARSACARNLFISVSALLLLNVFIAQAQWVNVWTSDNWYALQIGPLVARDSLVLAVSVIGVPIIRSTNYGLRWDTLTRPINYEIDAVAIASNGKGGSNFFMAGRAGIFRSTTNGRTWELTDSGFTNLNFRSIISIPRPHGAPGEDILIGASDYASNGYIFLSSDDGTTWHRINSNMPNNPILALAYVTIPGPKDSTLIFAGTSDRGLFYSSNMGANWIPMTSDPSQRSVRCITPYLPPDGSGPLTVFCGAFYDLYETTDLGATWAHMQITPLPDYVIAVIAIPPTPATRGMNLFAVTNAFGVLVYGRTIWTDANTGLIAGHPNSLAVSGNYLVAGTATSGVWRRPLDEILSEVPQNDSPAPPTFILQPNYPNPFNPSTTIVYGLPSPAYVSLKVVNSLGQVVGTLVNGNQQPGYHRMQWMPRNLPTGIYYCHLVAGGYLKVMKMLFVK